MKKLLLVMLVVLSTLVVWLPFALKTQSLPGWNLDFSKGMFTVIANFDGPNYVIVAKTWYDKEVVRTMFSIPLPLEYYPAHLPLYPALISIFDIALPGPVSMLLVTLIGSVLAALMFFVLVRDFKLGKNAFWLAVIFLFLPARWLVVRSIGSPEPWFIFFILASIYAFKKESFWMAGIFGALAQLTKSPAILLFLGYGLYFVIEGIENRRFNLSRYVKALPLLLIPLVTLPLFWFYKLQTGDFWAYFNSGDNFHLFWPPFSIFSPKGQYWTGDFWLEEMIWLWLIYGMGTFQLWRKGLKVEACFSFVFWISTLFVAHRDVSRYILPVAPLMIIGWRDVLEKKEFKWMSIILILPIFLYAWNFMLNNTSPVADWTPYL